MLRKASALLCLSVLLAACGGGEGASSDSPRNAAVAHSESSGEPTPTTVSEDIHRSWASSAALNRAEVQQTTVEALPNASEGPTTKAFAAPSAPLYRFYNIQTGAHLLTRDVNERDRTLNTLPQFRYEGAVFAAWSASAAGLSPVYRFYNTTTGTHFFTISETERATLQATRPDLRLEGAAYFASRTAASGTTALFRFYHRQRGFHFYTTSVAERDSIIANLAATYQYEGVGYYVNATVGSYANALSHFVGGGSIPYADGFGSNAAFNNIRGMSFDAHGNLYVVDRAWADGYSQWNHIRKVTPSGWVSTFAGDIFNTNRAHGSSLGYLNGTGKQITFDWLYSVTVGSDGNIFFGDGRTVRYITPSATSHDIAGDRNSYGYENGQREFSKFHEARSVAFNSHGDLLVADYHNSVIRRITPGGLVSAFVGTPSYVNVFGNFADGSGASARFSGPNQIAIDSNDYLYVTDEYNHRVRKISPAGVVSTLAGNGNYGIQDGHGTSARFHTPYAIAIDKTTNNLYVSDFDACTVRKVTPSGQVTTVLGIAYNCANNAASKVTVGSLPGRLASVGGLAINGRRLYIASGSSIYWTELP